MKLNLLPTSVSRGRNVGKAIVFSVLMSVFFIGLSFSMTVSSKNELEEARAKVNAERPPLEQTAAIAAEADKIVERATPFLRNINLIKAVDAHTTVYPDFYKSVMPLLPDFYRITTMRATPLNETAVNVAFNGVVKSTQYNDLRFALLRIANATNLQISAVGSVDTIVPNLTPVDMTGRMRKRNEPVVPDDGMARLNQALAKGGVTGFLGQGNFGSGNNLPRQAMPGFSVVNVSFIIPGHLQAPNIRATLTQIGPAPAPVGAPPAPTATGSAAPTGAKAPATKAPATTPSKNAATAPGKAAPSAATPTPGAKGAQPPGKAVPVKTAPAAAAPTVKGGQTR